MAAKKLNDVDLDFGELSPEKPLKTTDVAAEAIAAAVDYLNEHAVQLTPEEEYMMVLARLRKNTDKNWLCLPVVSAEGPLQLVIRELKTVDGETFLEWMKYAYPYSRELGFKAEDCDEYSYRKQIYDNVIANAGMFKFPSMKLATSLHGG